MPLFVWIAMAIALLLLGTGAATKLAAEPIAQFLGGPMGYVISGGFILIMAIAVWNKTKKS